MNIVMKRDLVKRLFIVWREKDRENSFYEVNWSIGEKHNSFIMNGHLGSYKTI